MRHHTSRPARRPKPVDPFALARSRYADPAHRVYVDPAADYIAAVREVATRVLQAADPRTDTRLLYSAAAVQAQRLGHLPDATRAEAIRVRVIREVLGRTDHSAETAKVLAPEADAAGSPSAPVLRLPRAPRRHGLDGRGAHRLGIGGR